MTNEDKHEDLPGPSTDDQSDKSDEGMGDQGPPEYYFNRAEFQVTRIWIDAMHFAGFAFGSQGVATALLGKLLLLACLVMTLPQRQLMNISISNLDQVWGMFGNRHVPS